MGSRWKRWINPLGLPSKCLQKNPCLQKWHLFRDTYAGHLEADKVTTGLQVTKLMVDSVQRTVKSEPQRLLWNVFAGTSCDSAYLSLNIDKYFAEEMHIPVDLVPQVTIHDYAHRMDLVDYWARKNVSWITNLGQDVTLFMKINKNFEERIAIQQKCRQLNIVFFELVLYSDTRFAQHRYRTYRVFLELYQVLYR